MACGPWPDIIQKVIEREIKLSFASAAEARAALVDAGAEPHAPRRLQDDALYDTDAKALFAGASALRLRREGGRALLTFKGPVQAGPMKTREEIESAVDDADAVAAMLVALGYRPWFRYQKYREELRAPGVFVAIDETPAGVFVEIEGDEPGIIALAKKLGRSDYILDSYRGLWVAAKGPDAGDMLFDD